MDVGEFEIIVEGERLNIEASAQVRELLHDRIPPIQGLSALLALLERLADAGTIRDKNKFETYTHRDAKLCAVKRKSDAVRLYGWRSKARPRVLVLAYGVDNKKSNKLQKQVLERVYKIRADYEQRYEEQTRGG